MDQPSTVYGLEIWVFGVDSETFQALELESILGEQLRVLTVREAQGLESVEIKPGHEAI